MAKCVVVGGNGFLGSYLVDELVRLGHEVTAFGRFSVPAPNYSAAGVRQVVGDFLNLADLSSALQGQEYLFHFLSTTTPASAEDDPTLDIRTNVEQSVELLRLAVEAGISRVYFASTGGAIYGEQHVASISESAVPSPVSPYAIGKQAIEGYLRYFHRKHGLWSVAFRISNPYGPRQHPNRRQGVIPIFLHRVAEGVAVDVFGNGSMVRDYIFAADAARMIAATVGVDTAHHVYNIGSGQGTALSEIIELVQEVTHRDVEVRHSEQPTTFVQRSVLDVSRYNAEFSERPLVSLREGVDLTWNALQGNHE